MPFPLLLNSKQLAELCHRLAVETESGIDVRRMWEREADRATGRLGDQYAAVRDGVAGGESLSAALARTGRLFPRVFLEMVEVGEQTGKLAEVFHSLSRYYRHRVDLRRKLLVRLTWPMFQLIIALFVVGVLILVMGVIGSPRGREPIDLLGFGLAGTQGLIIYLNVLLAVGIASLLAYGFIRRSTTAKQRISRLAMNIPVVGASVAKLALARITWAMHLVLNVEMDLRRAIPLVFRAADNDYYARYADEVVGAVVSGQPLAVAFRRTGVFPVDFLDALDVGEQSGQIVESMGRLSRHYEEDARDAMGTLAVIFGFCVWALVALVIILLIFRLFCFYVGMIEDAAAM